MLSTQPVTLADAKVIHRLYAETPQYFASLGTPVPTLAEVSREVSLALLDPRRRLELLREDGDIVGCLDYKLHYPARGDVTINLLLVRENAQSRGIGSRAVADFEERLPGGTRRVLASVLGHNERAARFWQRHGYDFAIDALPVMEWYAKVVRAGKTRGLKRQADHAGRGAAKLETPV